MDTEPLGYWEWECNHWGRFVAADGTRVSVIGTWGWGPRDWAAAVLLPDGTQRGLGGLQALEQAEVMQRVAWWLQSLGVSRRS